MGTNPVAIDKIRISFHTENRSVQHPPRHWIHFQNLLHRIPLLPHHFRFANWHLFSIFQHLYHL